MAESLQTWEYLERLRGVELHRLYRSPPSALAVFRKVLSGLAKHFVMMMLYSPRPLPLTDIDLMVRDGSKKERAHAIGQLRTYHIVRELSQRAGKSLALVPDFARSLREVLGGGQGVNAFGDVVSVATANRVSVEQLDEYSRQQWEGILGYMVGSRMLKDLQEPGEELSLPSQSVIELLKAGQLVTMHGTASRGQSATPTAEGFEFVLRDINTQIWTLLFLYVESAEDLKMDKIEVLSFIFFIASLELGLAYSTQSLNSTQKQILIDLVSLGIVYQPEAKSTYFYPTRLATTLTSESSSTVDAANANLGTALSANSKASLASNTSPNASGSGFIIIETNYRLYAYTSSPLQIGLLSLFVHLRSRHPNLVTAKMTKQSIQQAIRLGITADQIISYLTTHAHPQMRRAAAAEQAILVSRNQDRGRTVPVIPATILDQIHLWQIERDRMTTNTGYLLRDFPTQHDYEEPCKYADEIGVLVWKDDKKRMFFVSKVEGVQAFIKDRKERLNASQPRPSHS